MRRRHDKEGVPAPGQSQGGIIMVEGNTDSGRQTPAQIIHTSKPR